MSSSSDPAARHSKPGPGLLFSFGNILRGDDGIGPRLIDALRELDAANDIETYDLGNDGLKFLSLLDGHGGRVLVVDCGIYQGMPGSSRFVSPEEIREKCPPTGLSTHETRVLPLVRSAMDLHPDIKDIQIYAIRGIRFEFNTGLSPEVTREMPRFKTDILSYFKKE